MSEIKETKIQIIIPIFNEADVIETHLRKILSAANPPGTSYHLSMLVIDDGSKDSTREVLVNFCKEEPRVRFLSFTRNFGKESAIMAGLHHAEADAIILMDSDLQHPPELIPRMIELWSNGLKVVEAVKTHRGKENFFSKIFAKGFYKLFGIFSGLDIRGQSDYKLLDRCVVEQFKKLHERGRFFRGLIQWMGYPTAHLPFEVPDRVGGSSRWSKTKLIKYALHNITSFSAIPLQLVTWSGFISISFGFLFGFLALIQKLQGDAIDGFTTVILLLVFFSGILMLSLGIIGHYLSRIYDETKCRPSYILDACCFPPPEDPSSQHTDDKE